MYIYLKKKGSLKKKKKEIEYISLPPKPSQFFTVIFNKHFYIYSLLFFSLSLFKKKYLPFILFFFFFYSSLFFFFYPFLFNFFSFFLIFFFFFSLQVCKL
ncbi:hypothetical protein BD770DRAFT_123896 [Pilaira anomala]|nr:hypothetical protein BD770DRAFT_123896 [Pilaira anomala]